VGGIGRNLTEFLLGRGHKDRIRVRFAASAQGGFWHKAAQADAAGMSAAGECGSSS
jgi:hypothetical protein